MSCREFEALLDPYFDGELPIPEVLLTERHLAECNVCRGRYEALEWLRGEIKAARLDYVPSPAFEQKVRRFRPGGVKARRPWWWATGLVAASAAAFLIAPYLRIEPDRTGREFLDAHLRSLVASSPVDVPSSDQHTVKPWFQGRIGFAPGVPDLSQNGFVLVGGRLEVIHQQRAAALVYKHRAHVINLFIAEKGGAVKDRSTQVHGYNLISWADRGLSYWAVSDLNARELSDFTQLIRSKP